MKILVATDGLRHSEAAVRALRSLPFPEHTQVIIMTVVPGVLPMAPLVGGEAGAVAAFLVSNEAALRAAKSVVEEAGCLLSGFGFKVSTYVCAGSVADEICAVAEREEVDLILLGWSCECRRGFWEKLFGGTALKVMKRAPCSVLVIKQGRQWWEAAETESAHRQEGTQWERQEEARKEAKEKKEEVGEKGADEEKPEKEPALV